MATVAICSLLAVSWFPACSKDTPKRQVGAGSSTSRPTISTAPGGGAPPSTTTSLLKGPPPTVPSTVPPPTRSSRPTTELTLHRIKNIAGTISPKSVVASGQGVVIAQNMIYTHTVTVYDKDGNLTSTIPDTVDLAKFGVSGHPPGEVKGGPVEAAFSPDGASAWVTNYSMYGPGFSREGHDKCSPSSGYDSSFVYRINVATRAIDKVVPVGVVPKYVAVTPDGRYVLVTNWCTYDLSIIDASSGAEVRRVPMGGSYPRGIAVDPSSKTAYVAVRGGRDIVTVDLASFALGKITDVGSGPRHLVMSPDGSTLYVTLNDDGVVARVDVATKRVTARVNSGSQPRSMAISTDGRSLYVVNYDSSTLSKVDAATMTVRQTLATNHHPIGITYDSLTGRVWVACYSGTIEVFDES